MLGAVRSQGLGGVRPAQHSGRDDKALRWWCFSRKRPAKASAPHLPSAALAGGHRGGPGRSTYCAGSACEREQSPVRVPKSGALTTEARKRGRGVGRADCSCLLQRQAQLEDSVTAGPDSTLARPETESVIAPQQWAAPISDHDEGWQIHRRTGLLSSPLPLEARPGVLSAPSDILNREPE